MKRTLSRNLGSLPSGKVTLTLLTLQEPPGLFIILEVHWDNLFLSSCPVDFRRRFLSLLSYQFSTFSPSLALNILQNKNIKQQPQAREYPDWDSWECMAEHGWSLAPAICCFLKVFDTGESSGENLVPVSCGVLVSVLLRGIFCCSKGTNLFHSKTNVNC